MDVDPGEMRNNIPRKTSIGLNRSPGSARKPEGAGCLFIAHSPPAFWNAPLRNGTGVRGWRRSGVSLIPGEVLLAGAGVSLTHGRGV